MGLPTLTRSWQFAVNQSFADGALANWRAILRAIKNQLIGAGGLTWTDGTGTTITPAGNWTVIGSSDGTTAGLDAVDRWAADANLVFANAGSAHSWIVLQQTGISATFQMLIALDSNGIGYTCTINVSHVAFTGGSTTANPTSASSTPVLASANWGAANGGTPTTRVHVMRTTDGTATRVVLCRNGHVQALWSLELMSDLTSTVQGFVGFVVGNNATAPSAPLPGLTELLGTANWHCWGTAAVANFAAVEGWSAGTSVGQIGGVNSFTNEAPLCPIAIWSNTATQRGRYGALVDAWASIAANANGSTFPDTGTVKQFVQFGSVVLPWNRSTPGIT